MSLVESIRRALGRTHPVRRAESMLRISASPGGCAESRRESGAGTELHSASCRTCFPQTSRGRSGSERARMTPDTAARTARRGISQRTTAPSAPETARESAGTRSAGETRGGSRYSVTARATPTPTTEKNAICRNPGKEVRPRPAKLAMVVRPPSAIEGLVRLSVLCASLRRGEKHRWQRRKVG